MSEPDPTFEMLCEAAAAENWPVVDAALQHADFVNDPETLDAARGLLDSEDDDSRDLGASIFEASSLELDQATTQSLFDIVLHDEHPYARYRAAFALWKHGNRGVSVTLTIQAATNDEDVGEIAATYLSESG